MEIELTADSPYAEGELIDYEDGTYTLERDTNSIIEQQPGDLIYTIVYGDNLSNLAGANYGTSKLWHIIARANPDLVDFFTLVPGTDIRIPNPANYQL
jgi:nucleoid-associated protein YgaU